MQFSEKICDLEFATTLDGVDDCEFVAKEGELADEQAAMVGCGALKVEQLGAGKREPVLVPAGEIRTLEEISGGIRADERV